MAQTTVNIDIKVNTKSIAQLEDELNAINDELKGVAINSEAFDKLSKESQKLTKELDKATQAAEGLTDDKKFMAADGAIKVLGGSLAGVVGVLGTIGFESEVFGEMEKKAASAIAVAVGIKDVSEGYRQLRESTVLASAATKLFGKVTKTALISTGIGALVVALGTVVAYWDEINEYVKSIGSESLDDVNDKLQEGLEISEGTVGVLESQKALLEGRGENTREVNAALLEQLSLQIDITNQLIQQKQLELAETRDENAEVSFWEKTKLAIFQATNAWGAYATTVAEAVNPEDEKTKELQTEINDLLVKNNQLKLQYTQTEQEYSTQVEMSNFNAQNEILNLEAKGVKLAEVGQIEGATIDATTLALQRKMQAEQAATDAAERALQVEQGRTEALYATGEALGALGGILNQESAAAKALAISQAVINTYLGVTEVLKQKSTLPSPFDVIVKIANVATILASGFKAVQGIKSTPAQGSSSATPRQVSAGTPRTTAPSSVATAAQASVPQVINTSPTVRAYVLSGDVTSSQEADSKLATRRVVG